MSDVPPTDLLRDVSRSFYLTLRVLPAAIRGPIGLGYLLARTTDTIADTGLMAVEGRLEALARLRERILGRGAGALDFGPLAQNQSSPAEQTLLSRCEETLRSLEQLSEGDRARVRKVLEIIISGQELDLRRFGGASVKHIVALESDAELDDYTWRVAGCVGEFWTETCRAHLFGDGEIDAAFLRQNGVRFGKGLQLVNILRDLPTDLRQGRCYVPGPALRAANLTPESLLEPGTMAAFRPVYDCYLDMAQGHLAAGWNYTNALPRSQRRLRLGCAWPLLIGARTVRKLRVENALDASRRIKVSRPEVRTLMGRSILLLAWPAGWRRQFERESAAANGVASPRGLP